MPDIVTPAPATGVAKPAWQSKTLWVSAVVALAPFIPGVGGFVAANPQAVALGLGVVFGVLRLITKGGVTIT